MSGLQRRHGGAGIRRSVRGGSGGPSIQSILGNTRVAHYGGWNYDDGTPPDVASAANLASLTAGTYDIANGTPASRPHAVSRAAGEAWEFSGAQRLINVNETPNLLETGDLATFWVVGSVPNTGNHGLLDLSDSDAANRGALLFIEGTDLKARALPVSAGQTDATQTRPADSDVHVYRLSLLADRVTCGIDGAEASTLVTTGGIRYDLDTAIVGSIGGSTYQMNGDLYEIVVAKAPSAAQIAAADAFLISKYGTV